MVITTSFGHKHREMRRHKNITVIEMAGNLRNSKGKPVSPSYITRIESYGEIPRPEVIIQIAEVFGVDPEEWLKMAREQKVTEYDQELEERYREAVGLFRTRKKRD